MEKGVFWFLAAGAGLFYAFWKTTAPTESEYREALERARADADAQAPEAPADQPEDSLRGEAAEEEREVPLIEHANAESLGEKPYDPASNPFKATQQESKNGDGFPGSFDDIMPDETPLEDYVEGEEDDDAARI